PTPNSGRDFDATEEAVQWMPATAFDALATAPRWVAWRNERRGDKGKPTKVPYSPVLGGAAKANDPSTWGERSAAEARLEELPHDLGGGVGIELGDLGHDAHIAGIDLDSCLADGTVADWAQRILDAAGTYAERSPSLTGLKLFFYM